MNLNPNEIYEKLTMLGEAWADAQYSAELLEELKKSMLSELSQEANETSIAARESFALRHPDYKKHIEGMVTARRAANKARVRYDSARVYSDLIRTVNANERHAMRNAV